MSVPPDSPVLKRPIVVTVALVFVYLNAFSNLILGVLVLLSRYRVDADEVLIVTLVGAAIALFGLLTLAVASAVARGSRLSRVLVTVWTTILLVLNTVTVIRDDEWDIASLAVIAVQVFVLVVLWLPASSRFFRAAPQRPEL